MCFSQQPITNYGQLFLAVLLDYFWVQIYGKPQHFSWFPIFIHLPLLTSLLSDISLVGLPAATFHKSEVTYRLPSTIVLSYKTFSKGGYDIMYRKSLGQKSCGAAVDSLFPLHQDVQENVFCRLDIESGVSNTVATDNHIRSQFALEKYQTLAPHF